MSQDKTVAKNWQVPADGVNLQKHATMNASQTFERKAKVL